MTQLDLKLRVDVFKAFIVKQRVWRIKVVEKLATLISCRLRDFLKSGNEGLI